MTTHGNHDPLVDYDDHSSKSKETEDRPVNGEPKMWCETNGGDGDDNTTLRLNDMVNETESTVADVEFQSETEWTFL